MKVLLSSLILARLAASANALFTPYRLTFDTLSADDLIDDDSFLGALTTTGMVSITGLPDAAKQAARTMTAMQHACLTESANTQEQTMMDGTIRLTMATHTVAGVGGMQALKHETENSEACMLFEEAATSFRKMTHAAVTAFAAQLTQLLHVSEGPLLMTSPDEELFPFTTFADVVRYGEHLEHFHCYQKIAESQEQQSTIDVHTDQGLFLAFTPGRLSTGKLTSGFFIKTADGSTEQVDFTDADELVFLLGDGVNQYVNDKLMGGIKLRAVPHALQLESHAEHEARVWYGLMVLPPAAAVHPAHGVTFGEIRQGLIEGHEDAIHLACSNAISDHRFLDDAAAQNTTCENADELYCWHQCMNVTSYNVSSAQCSAASQVLKCINPRDQVSTGLFHGDYFPGCISPDAMNETAFPRLPDYPRNDSSCTDFATVFAANGGESGNSYYYSNSVTLTGGNGALLQYNVTGTGAVKGRFAFNGIFGYLGFGFAGVGGKNAMLSGRVILATRGGGYTAHDGLNLTLGPQVSEYVINANATAFRTWSTPYSDPGGAVETTATGRSSAGGGGGRVLHEASYAVEAGDCYTAITFDVHGIAGQNFNLGGTDKMIWAANDVDTFMGYHGVNKGIFEIDWTAAAVGGGNASGSDGTSGTQSTVSGSSGASSVLSSSTATTMMALVAAVAVLLAAAD